MSRSLSTFPFFKTVAGTQDNVFWTMEPQSQTLRRHRWPLSYYFANRNTVDLPLYESICVIRKGARGALNGKLSCFDSHVFFYVLKFIFFESSSDRGPQEPQKVQILVIVCSVSLHPVSTYVIFRLLPDMNTLGEGASLLKFTSAHRIQMVRPLLVILK